MAVHAATILKGSRRVWWRAILTTKPLYFLCSKGASRLPNAASLFEEEEIRPFLPPTVLESIKKPWRFCTSTPARKAYRIG